MQQLTIRGFDQDLEREIRRLAQAENISLNKAVIRLLRRGAGLERRGPSSTIGRSLDHLAGTWSEDDARQMEEAEKDFEQIDPEIWS